MGFCKHHNTGEAATSPAELLQSYGEEKAQKRSKLHKFHTLDAPTEFPLIPDAGVKRNLIAAGCGKGATVRFAHLGHGSYLVVAGSQPGGQGDGVAQLEVVDFSKIGVCAPVMSTEGDISIPNAGVLEVARALLEHGAVGPFKNSHRQTDGRNIQRSEGAVLIVEIVRDLGIAGGA